MTRCAAALSTHPVVSHATGDVIADLLQYGDAPPSLVLVFLTESFGGAAEDVAATVGSVLRTRVIAIVSTGVIGAGTEATGRTALSAWALWSDASSHVVELHRLDDGVDVLGAQDRRDLESADLVLVFGAQAHPGVTTSIDTVCELRGARPTAGGLLSAVVGDCRVWDQSRAHYDVVAITINGFAIHAQTVHPVRSLGGSNRVTRTVGPMILELDGSPALGVVEGILARLEPDQRPGSGEQLVLSVHDTRRAPPGVVALLGGDRSSGAIATAVPVDDGALVSLGIDDEREVGRSMRVPIDDRLPIVGALILTGRPLDPSSIPGGTAALGQISEALSTTDYAGVHLASVIGPSRGHSGLTTAPITAVLLRRGHH